MVAAMFAPPELRKKPRACGNTNWLSEQVGEFLSGRAESAPKTYGPRSFLAVCAALDLWEGRRQWDIVRERGLSYHAVRAVAKAIGWDSSWVVGPKRGHRPRRR